MPVPDVIYKKTIPQNYIGHVHARRKSGTGTILLLPSYEYLKWVDMRTVPIHKSPSTLAISGIYSATICLNRPLPFFTSTIQAGFPSPADGYLEGALDLNELVVNHPAATFYVKVQGDSMINAGIHSGDILVVDRSLSAHHKSIIVAVLDGEFTVKRLILEKNELYLFSENLSYPPIQVSKEAQFEVWGVVTYVIHKAS